MIVQPPNHAILRKDEVNADLNAEHLAVGTIIEESDQLPGDIVSANAELTATKRDLAMVKHQLAASAPLEISIFFISCLPLQFLERFDSISTFTFIV